MHRSAQIDPDHVAAYIRWSTDDQGEGTTLAVQTEACRHYFQALGWSWRDEFCFVDDGYSGGSLDRPGLTALRVAVREGRVQCVVVYKLDRLSRSVLDTVKLALEEWEGCCYVKSTREPIDTANAAGKMFFYMLVSYAEWERSVIRERTLAGKRRRAQEGRNPGIRLPYGYRKGESPGEMRVDPDQAAVVRRIFSAYVRGKGLTTIAAELNREAVPTGKSRALWRVSSVRWILQNAAYKGVLAYGKTSRTTDRQRAAGKKSVEVHDPPRHALVEGAFPIIVEPRLWAEAQLVASARAKAPRRSLAGAYLLSGIARCRCGAPLIGNSADRGRYRFYYCSLRNATGKHTCGAGGISAGDLEAAVVEAVRAAAAQAASEPEKGSRQRAVVLADLQEQLQAAGAGLAAVERAQAGIARRLRRLHDDYDQGTLAAGLYSQRVAELNTEQARLQARWDLLSADRRGLAETQRTAESIWTAVEAESSRVQTWPISLSREEEKQVLRHLVERLTAWRVGGERDGDDRRRVRPVVEVELVLREP